jgi:hypothetical protein
MVFFTGTGISDLPATSAQRSSAAEFLCGGRESPFDNISVSTAGAGFQSGPIVGVDAPYSRIAIQPEFQNDMLSVTGGYVVDLQPAAM